MNRISSPTLSAKLKLALSRPPKIVSAYLDAGCIGAVQGAGQTVQIGTPAGGSFRGWWSNGCHLIYKDQAVAMRDDFQRTLAVLPEFLDLFTRSSLVKGLSVITTPSFD
ncbi:hypothetical protein [Pseudomonas aeruginosa]|uniref:hypothetical protein n=1 Tax=Pseudomonas aeruginosa TaxID=287 RepID=UPI0027383048|nr:hypothetical protein [Pseudomonas aeruginosa]